MPCSSLSISLICDSLRLIDFGLVAHRFERVAGGRKRLEVFSVVLVGLEVNH